MKLSNRNYPYPILVNNSNDYINCLFDVSILEGPSEQYGQIHLELEYTLTSKGLMNLIGENKAYVMVHVKSPLTSFRKNYIFKSNTLNIDIPKELLGAKIEYISYIIAAEDIENIHFSEHNPIFFDDCISIKKGDKLAIGDVISFNLEPYDALRPIASIVAIKELKGKTKESIDLDLSNDKIIIYLNSDTFTQYKNLRTYPELRMYLSLNIVMPAIIEALSEIKNNIELDLEKKWVTSLKRTLSSLKIDIYSSELSLYSIANKIFKNGVLTSINSLEKFCDLEEKL